MVDSVSEEEKCEAKVSNAKHARSGDASVGVTLPADKSKSTRKSPVVKLAVALFAVVVSVGVASGLYFASLEAEVAYEGDIDALREVLVEANYEDPFYVLVIGSDNWRDHGARSDAMILARVDLKTPQVTMVSIPRDNPYKINGNTIKLNEVYSLLGETGCIQAVSEVTGVDISHYVEVEFSQLESVVNELGGVTVEVPYAFDYEVHTQDEPVVHVDAGLQTLTGEQAVAFARMRTAYEDSNLEQDAIRQANVRAMAVGIIKKVLSAPVSEMPGLIRILFGMVQTDIPLSVLVSWATELAGADEFVMYSCTGPTEGAIDPQTSLWLTNATEEDWARLMEVVNSGQDPSGALGGVETDGSVSLSSKDTVVRE